MLNILTQLKFSSKIQQGWQRQTQQCGKIVAWVSWCGGLLAQSLHVFPAQAADTCESCQLWLTCNTTNLTFFVCLFPKWSKGKPCLWLKRAYGLRWTSWTWDQGSVRHYITSRSLNEKVKTCKSSISLYEIKYQNYWFQIGNSIESLSQTNINSWSERGN